MLWLAGTATAQTGRPPITNSVRVIVPRLLNTNQGVRTIPGQLPGTPKKTSPFLNSVDTMAPLPGATTPKPATPNVPGRATPITNTRTTPRATTTTTPATTAVPAPKRPAIAAPSARRPDAGGNILGSARAQNARETLAEMVAEASGTNSVKPKYHTLVPAHKANEVTALRYKNSPLEQILEEYSRITERTMLTGSGLNKQVTMDIVALDDTEMTNLDAIQAFDIVLNQNQIAVVPIGDKFLLAVPAAQATKEGLPFLDLPPDQLPEAPTLVTKIVQLEYAEPKDVVQVIQKFAKVAGGITSVESTKMLIIQDYAINLKRMLELIAKVDVAAPANEQIFKVIPIRYAPVQEVADMLGTFTAKGSASGSARTTGTSARSSGGGVRNPASSANRSSVNNRSTSSANRGFRPLQQNRVPAPTRVAQPASSAASFNARLRSIVSAANNDEPEPLLGNASISYYERSNSILVRGTKGEIEKVEKLIEELDKVQPQVLIEAVIMDVSLTDNQQFGVNILQNRTPLGNGVATAGGVNNNAGGFFNAFGGTNTFSSAISTLAGGFSYYGIFGQRFETVVRAVETENFATVLSRPQILTTHAEPARLFVGETLPFPSSSGADFSGISRVAISQVDIGITLDILPLINPDGLVILEIEQTTESFRGFEEFGELRAPRTTRREASSKIAVNNGQTIILGGLINNTKDNIDTGVPILRKVPVLKHLFKQNTKNNARSELILMLRPIVLETPEIAEARTEEARQMLPGVRRAEMSVGREDQLWQKKADEEAKRYAEEDAKKAKKKGKWELPIDLFDLITEDE